MRELEVMEREGAALTATMSEFAKITKCAGARACFESCIYLDTATFGVRHDRQVRPDAHCAHPA